MDRDGTWYGALCCDAARSCATRRNITGRDTVCSMLILGNIILPVEKPVGAVGGGDGR